MDHCWGDEWLYWKELYKAENWINNIYFKCRKKYPCTKEKYGTIRYENTFGWIVDKEDWLTFKKIIRRAVRKFPNVAGEIVADLVSLSADEYFEAWCAGIYWVSNGGYWQDIKGIKGFY